MSAELEAVRELLPGAPLEVIGELGGSRRSVVHRVRAGEQTVIVKQYLGDGDGWVRECAALSALPDGTHTPRLIASGRTPPIVVMSDVGSGGSVADALLGRDPQVASDALVSWATAIAGLHRATAGSRASFRTALDPSAPESSLAEDLDHAAGVLEPLAVELGVRVPAAAMAELRGLADRLNGDRHAALTPADACPDNNIGTARGLMLIDFEGGQWRHVAWDVAYLTVPWPTCWCSWRLPESVVQRAFDTYRALAGDPYVDSPEFRRDVAVAAAGWVYISVSWFLASALAHDKTITHPVKPSPRRRAAILHRLGVARQVPETPALAALAAGLQDALTARWGALTLPYAPAFREMTTRDTTTGTASGPR